jgi:non-specific serine/threonine protein kinase
MDITLQAIQNLVTPVIFRRGFEYYRQSRVRLERVDSERIEAYVEGQRYYHVVITRRGKELDTDCDCPYWDTCKHVAATLLKAKEYIERNRAEISGESKLTPSARLLKRMTEESVRRSGTGRKPWRLIYLIELFEYHWTLTPKKAYVRLNGELGRLSEAGEVHFDSESVSFAPADPYVLATLQDLFGGRVGFGSPAWNPGRAGSERRRSLEYGSKLGGLFDLLGKSPVYIAVSRIPRKRIVFDPLPGRIEAEFQRTGSQYEMSVNLVSDGRREPLSGRDRMLTADPCWLLRDHALVRMEEPCPKALIAAAVSRKPKIRIPQPEFIPFLETLLTAADVQVQLPAEVRFQPVTSFSERMLTLRERDERLEMTLMFQYAGQPVDFSDPRNVVLKHIDEPLSFLRIVRDAAGEKEALLRLEKSGVKRDGAGRLFVPPGRALHWLVRRLPHLAASGFTVFGREALKKYRVRACRPRLNVEISSGIDWFDLKIDVDFEGSKVPAGSLRDAIETGGRIVRLSDGSLGELPEAWLRKIRALFQFARPERDGLRFSRWHAGLVDSLIEEASSARTDGVFRRNLAFLKDFSGIARRQPPSGLRGTLRPYQKAGFEWLCFLKEGSFGGLLADDMGLGKTIQALAFLQKEKETGSYGPCLIVCPTSVVFNWENEIRKFTPGLRVMRHAGQERLRNVSAFRNTDLVLTTYGVLLRDISLFRQFAFHCVILDESQKIKNPATQSSRAVRLLNVKHRLALTGTPVENRSIELWSQFAFLNPGMLGPLQGFRRQFASAVDRDPEGEEAALLRKLVHPFILRRTKDVVAKELPPKVELTYFCPMTAPQEKLYQKWKDAYRGLILKKIEEQGLQKSRMLVLEGLLRLRQIACHPRLVGEARHASEKFESLKEILGDILSEGHKVLIFSQFVEMLKIIREHLVAEKIDHAYLDGKTRDREKEVREFQTRPDLSVFLISLRAGGTGINLTAADYVILYDPWWNPAVETQAVDRAHRIGQNKKVFVYKMVSKGTIEEKVLELQEKKKKLVSKLISGEASGFKSLTKDDIEALFR